MKLTLFFLYLFLQQYSVQLKGLHSTVLIIRIKHVFPRHAPIDVAQPKRYSGPFLAVMQHFISNHFNYIYLHKVYILLYKHIFSGLYNKHFDTIYYLG